MAEVVRFVGTDGSFMLVETELTRRAEGDIGLVAKEKDGAAVTVATKLEDSLGSVRGAAVALMSTVNAIGCGYFRTTGLGCQASRRYRRCWSCLMWCCQ